MITRRSASEEETVAFGRELAARLPTDAIILLIGELGAGKTTLAKGLAEGFGIRDHQEVRSPTYSLVHEYPLADGVLYHIDLYRLETAREQASIGLEEMAASGRPMLVEWADRLHLKLDGAIEIRIGAENQERVFSVLGLRCDER